jgi:hypothetical protein
MKPTLMPRKPRNPFAIAARSRAAGSHRRNGSGQRQRAARELRAELARSSP